MQKHWEVMSVMLLAVNTLVRYSESHVERILWMDKSESVCFVIDILQNRMPVMKPLKDIEEGILNGELQIVEQEQFFPSFSIELLSDKAREKLEFAWRIVEAVMAEGKEPDLFYPHIRKAIIDKVSAEFGVSEKTVLRYLLAYWKKGKTKFALAPAYSRRGGKNKPKKAGDKKRGRPRLYDQAEGINITEDIEQIFRVALKRYYYTSKKAPLKFAYQKMIQQFFSQPSVLDDGTKASVICNHDNLPSYTQFKYFFHKENTIKREVSTRQSLKKYELAHRPVLGSATAEAIGPGSKFLLDGTTFDIYLVSRFNRNWIIGRPCLYYVQDVFSRMVTGIYVGLETSWLSAAMAIANCVEDKVSFCAKYGITIKPEDWETHHLPETILGDRGELFSKEVETLVKNLHIKIENTSSYRGDLKSIIERHFKTTNDSVKMMLPGVINPDFRQRGSRDYRLDAKLDLYQFTQIIIRCVLYHNHRFMPNYPRQEMMISDDIESIPSKLWRWGIQHRSGALREVSKDLVLLNMLPSSEALVTYRGIKFQGLFYSSATVLKERWLEKARSGTWRVPICYDPRNMGVIYLKGIGEKGFEPCHLLEHYHQFGDKTKEEIEYLHAMENWQKSAYAKNELQSHIDLITHIESIVKEAEKLTKEQQKPSSKAERLRGIRENRRMEKEFNRFSEAFVMQPVNQEDQANKDNVTVVSDYINDFDLFWKKMREGSSIESDPEDSKWY
jgi:hypothetical protein